MEGTVDKEDLLNVYKELKESNKKLTDICFKQGRLHSAIETLRDNQKEHHETLYDQKTGLETRVQKIENYATATLSISGLIAGAVAFKEKIVAWFN